MRNDKKEWILLRSTNIWFFGEGMLGPLLAVLTEKVGGDILDISGAWAIFLFVTGVLTILISYFADTKKGLTEKMMIWGYVLNAIFTFGYLLVDSPYKLFFVEAGLGIATALANPTWDALYAKYEDRKHPAFTWGKAEGYHSITTAIAIIFGGIIVSYFSFNLLFIIMGIIQIIAVISQIALFRKYKRGYWAWI